MRIARDLGTVSQVLPEGVTLADCPYHIHDAISKALLFLSFSEELAEDERPPKRIWLDGEALSEWFEGVKRMRKEKYGEGGSSEIENAKVNDATRSLIVE